MLKFLICFLQRTIFSGRELKNLLEDSIFHFSTWNLQILLIMQLQCVEAVPTPILQYTSESLTLLFSPLYGWSFDLGNFSLCFRQSSCFNIQQSQKVLQKRKTTHFLSIFCACHFRGLVFDGI